MLAPIMTPGIDAKMNCAAISQRIEFRYTYSRLKFPNMENTEISGMTAFAPITGVSAAPRMKPPPTPPSPLIMAAKKATAAIAKISKIGRSKARFPHGRL